MLQQILVEGVYVYWNYHSFKKQNEFTGSIFLRIAVLVNGENR